MKHKSILNKFKTLLLSSLSMLRSKIDENAMRILYESYSCDVGDSVLSAVGELYLWYSELQQLQKRTMGPLEPCPGGIFL